jgi:undecaprenyl-diphosphatase
MNVEVLQYIDERLFLILNRDIANKFFDYIFPVITNGYFWIIPGIIAAIWFLIKEKKKAIYILLLSLATVSLSDPLAVRIIKPLVGRERPCSPNVLINGGRFLLEHKTSFSFPSAHATNAFAQAMLFAFFYRQFAVWFFSLAFLIGFSRIYVGVHYPSDVLAGACLGMLVAWIVIGAHIIIQKKFRIMPSPRSSPKEEGI